jgi:hypothetical protein
VPAWFANVNGNTNTHMKGWEGWRRDLGADERRSKQGRSRVEVEGVTEREHIKCKIPEHESKSKM